MRAWVVLGCVAGGVAGCGLSQPPRQTEFPTLERGDTYFTRIASLRTTLGRAGIALRIAGHDAAFATQDCDSVTPLETFGGCARCELAGETTPMDGALIEATTRAFARYPTEVLVATKIAHVAVCREIVLESEGEVEHPAGLADVHGHGLLLGVKYFLDRTYHGAAEFTVDDIAHHEVFHLLEHEQMRAEMLDDPEWRVHNPVGFEYASRAKSEARRAGFVTAYAMTAAHEDKASVYQYLMAHADELCELARTDEVLRTKTRIVWRRVRAAVGTDAFLRAAAPCVDWLDD